MNAHFLPPLANPLAYRTANADLFTPQECQSFLDDTERSPWNPVEMTNDGRVVRSVTVQEPDFAARSAEFTKLVAAVTQTNEQFFRFDLSGVWDYDAPVLIRYTDGQGHYEWHTDAAERSPRRKLSYSVLLSDPDTYEGGDLEIRGYGIAPRVQGGVNIFPAFAWHRVTPVTAGVRVVLVGWIQGPTFR